MVFFLNHTNHKNNSSKTKSAVRYYSPSKVELGKEVKKNSLFNILKVYEINQLSYQLHFL